MGRGVGPCSPSGAMEETPKSTQKDAQGFPDTGKTATAPKSSERTCCVVKEGRGKLFKRTERYASPAVKGGEKRGVWGVLENRQGARQKQTKGWRGGGGGMAGKGKTPRQELDGKGQLPNGPKKGGRDQMEGTKKRRKNVNGKRPLADSVELGGQKKREKPHRTKGRCLLARPCPKNPIKKKKKR